jgi:hypothetical protein
MTLDWPYDRVSAPVVTHLTTVVITPGGSEETQVFPAGSVMAGRCGDGGLTCAARGLGVSALIGGQEPSDSGDRSYHGECHHSQFFAVGDALLGFGELGLCVRILHPLLSLDDVGLYLTISRDSSP